MTPRLVRTVTTVVVLAICPVAAGCGGSESSVPPKEARLAVTSFLHAMQELRFSGACALVMPDVRADLRLLALGSFRPTGSTFAVRQREVAAAHDRARTCPEALALLAAELGSRTTNLEREVTAADAVFLGPGRRVVVLDDEAWVVTRGDNGWQIETTNAISDALPQG